MIAFGTAMVNRLVNDTMDAVETVTKDEPGLRVGVVNYGMI